MNATKDYAVTMFGITALQMPTLVSIAPKESILFNCKRWGFPFNMERQFMKEHIAFSPVNVFAGRFQTLFTSVYYHTGETSVLVLDGKNESVSVLLGETEMVISPQPPPPPLIVSKKNFLHREEFFSISTFFPGHLLDALELGLQQTLSLIHNCILLVLGLMYVVMINDPSACCLT